MKCHELEEYLSEHLEGELDKARMDALLDHIETCERCRAEFQAYQGQEKQLRRYFLRERAAAERIANPLQDQFAGSPVSRLGKSDGSDRSDNLQSPVSSIRNPQSQIRNSQSSVLSTQHSALSTRRWVYWAAAAIFCCVVGVGGWQVYRRAVPMGGAQLAVIKEIEGRVLTLSKGIPVPAAPGDPLRQSQRIKVASGGYLSLQLPDGNIIEAKGGTQLALNEYADRLEVAMDRGQVWAHLPSKPAKRFTIRTAHLVAGATGTVFGVAEGLDRSEVSVARGTVIVESSGAWTTLPQGETYTSRQGAEAGSPAAMIAWSHLKEDLAALQSVQQAVAQTSEMPLRLASSDTDQPVGQSASQPAGLVGSVGSVGSVLSTQPSALSTQPSALSTQPSALSPQSSALSYMPDDTRYLLEIPDVGVFAKEFQSSDYAALGKNEAIRQWWLAVGGPRVLEDISKEIPLNELAGIARCMEGPLTAGVNRQGQPLLLADCGANTAQVRLLLEQAIAKAQATGRAGAPGSGDTHDPANEIRSRVLLSDRWLVVSTSPELAQDAFQRLTSNRPTGFTQSAFCGKLRRDAPNPRFMIAANLEDQVADWIKYAKERNLSHDLAPTLDLLGLPSLDYLLLSPDFAGHGMNQAARLAFGPEGRDGVMNWLAEPSPMRGLNFFSPDVHVFASAIVRNPYRMFLDYLLYLQATGKENDFRQALEVVAQREDFLKSFGGEIAVGIDSPVLPVPNVKIAIEVSDHEAFQKGLDQIVSDLLRAFEREGKIAIVEDVMHKDRTIYTLVIDGVPFTPAWTFVDTYFIAGPGPQFVRNSIDVYESRHSIASDSRLAALLPGNLDMNFSMLLYQDLARSIPAVFREKIAPKLSAAAAAADAATSGTAPVFRLTPAFDVFQNCRAPSIAYAFARPQCVDLYLSAPAGLDFNLGVGVPLVANWLAPRTSIGLVVKRVAQAQFGLEQLQKAALKFQSENGRLPASLDELDNPPGKYLDSIPLDPFAPDGQTLRLIQGPEPGRITFYSIGPDGVDNEGKAEYSIVRQYDGPGDIVIRVGAETQP